MKDNVEKIINLVIGGTFLFIVSCFLLFLFLSDFNIVLKMIFLGVYIALILLFGIFVFGELENTKMRVLCNKLLNIYLGVLLFLFFVFMIVQIVLNK